MLISNYLSLNFKKHLNILFLLAPFFIIAGPFFLNLYVILIFIFCLTWFLNNKSKIIFKKYELFFLLFIIYLFLNNFLISNWQGLLKVLYLSIFLFCIISFRYFNFTIDFNKKIKKIYLLLFLIISLDALLQFIIGKNILSFELAAGNRVSGIFDDEAILGSFMSKFIVLLLGILFFIKKNISLDYLKIIFFFLIFFIIFLSGERVAFIYSIFFCIIFLIYSKQFKFFFLFISLFLIFNLLLFTSTKSNNYKLRYLNFIGDLGLVKSISDNYSTQSKIDSEHKKHIEIIENIDPNFDLNAVSKSLGISVEKAIQLQNNEKINYNSFLNTYHGGLFARSLILSSERFFWGHGIKMYRKICNIQLDQTNKVKFKNFYYKGNLYKFYCSTHPHNIYLEILVETGIIGLFLFFCFIYYFFIELKRDKKDIIYNSLIITNLALFFPFLSTGSFFSSQYFIYFFFFIIFAVNYKTQHVSK